MRNVRKHVKRILKTSIDKILFLFYFAVAAKDLWINRNFKYTQESIQVGISGDRT